MKQHQDTQRIRQLKKKAKKRINPDGTESDLERLFLSHWIKRYPTFPPINNYEFHATRKWRFDFAWVTHKIAVEIQGMGPGHCSLPGMTKDHLKHMAATIDNWKIIYLTTTLLLPENESASCAVVAKLLGIYKTPQTGYVPLSQRK